jgi:hypothetical protein
VINLDGIYLLDQLFADCVVVVEEAVQNQPFCFLILF